MDESDWHDAVADACLFLAFMMICVGVFTIGWVR